MAEQSTLQKSRLKRWVLLAEAFLSTIKSSKRFKRTVVVIAHRRKHLALLLLAAAIVYAGSKVSLPKIKKSRTQPLTLCQTSPNGSRELWVRYKGDRSPVVVHPTNQTTFDAHRRLFLDQSSMEKKRPTSQFLREVTAIGHIVLPRFRTRVVALLFVLVALLSTRTYLSLLVARLDGRIVRDLIGANAKEFFRGIGEWLLLAVPASYTNAMIKYVEGRLSLELRTLLIRYIHDLYIAGNAEYYKVENIDGGVQGVDHYITSDVNHFCDTVASLFSRVGKPTIDMLFFAYQLSKSLGTAALAGLFVNYGLTALVLKNMAPPFGRLAAQEAALEGEYRSAHARLITNAEEIAFYDGASIERESLQRSFANLVQHVANLLKVNATYAIFEDLILKYSWSASGFLFLSIPVFMPDLSGKAAKQALQEGPHRERQRMGHFITDRRLMLAMADAAGRIMYSIKDFAILAGYTQRLYELLSTLHRVRANTYAEYATRFFEDTPEYSLADVSGTVQRGFDGFRLEDVPVVVPGTGVDLTPGMAVVQPVRLSIQPGEHLLITGPNDSGKTSLARIAAGLWPVYRGLLSLPRRGGITFLPQRPYFVTGSLRDQVIYPSTHEDMLASGATDDQLLAILASVRLDYLVSREGGWDARKEWKDVFSGGEKQRMLFARILYAKPRFAVIDEGTSAVSQDVEGLLYEVCKKQNITLVTISHRIALLKHHNCLLELGLGDDGDEWRFQRRNSDDGRKSVRQEIDGLKTRLDKLPELRKRRDEIVKQLGHCVRSAPTA